MNSSVPLLPCTIKKKAKVICFFFSILHLPRTWRYSDIPRFFLYVTPIDAQRSFYYYSLSLSLMRSSVSVCLSLIVERPFFSLLFSDVLTSFFSCFFLETAFFSLCFFFLFLLVRKSSDPHLNNKEKRPSGPPSKCGRKNTQGEREKKTGIHQR